MFLDDQQGGSDSRMEQEELPTAIITMLTKCYSVTCDDENPCYLYSCPRKVCFCHGGLQAFLIDLRAVQRTGSNSSSRW